MRLGLKDVGVTDVQVLIMEAVESLAPGNIAVGAEQLSVAAPVAGGNLLAER